MKPSADNSILCLIAALSLAAGAVVVAGSLTHRSRSAQRSFQQAVGGLGLGCQLDIGRSSWHFDPRIDDDNAGLDVIPALGQLSPWHAIALFPSSAGSRLAEE
ncbi:MAG TPA: hypothetical protein VF306_00230 [Pirellulales bacterium]